MDKDNAMKPPGQSRVRKDSCLALRGIQNTLNFPSERFFCDLDLPNAPSTHASRMNVDTIGVPWTCRPRQSARYRGSKDLPFRSNESIPILLYSAFLTPFLPERKASIRSPKWTSRNNLRIVKRTIVELPRSNTYYLLPSSSSSSVSSTS